jgi:hypothetical protein
MTNSPEKRNSLLQDEDHFGQKIASHLSTAASELPHDISERLRAARVQALAQRKIAKTRPASTAAPAGDTTAQAGESDRGRCCDEAVSA